MKKIYYIIVLFLLIGSVNGICQEQVAYTQYMYNKYEFNSAFAGLQDKINIYGQIRNQWSNLELNPSTYLLNADMPIRKDGAVGFKISRDQLGYFNDYRLSASYNYIYTGNYGLYSAGLGLGYRQLNIDGSKLRTPDGDYSGIIDHNDELLLGDRYLGGGLIWDVGIAFLNNNIEAGLSISNFSFSNLNFSLYDQSSNPDVQFFFQYNLKLSKGLILKPMTLIITDFKTSLINISSVIDYYGKIFAGFSVQTNNKIKIPSFGISIGTRINQNLKVYYSYEKDLSSLRTFHDGTHEIVFNYSLNKIIGRKGVLPIIYSPRNL